jgi:hypothetical protein
MAPVILQLSAVTSQKRSRALALMADHPLVFEGSGHETEKIVR